MRRMSSGKAKNGTTSPQCRRHASSTASGAAWPGYIPDLRSAAYGGYGADVSTRIAIGAGEAIMERHLINLYGLLGMWKDQPGRP